MSGDGEMVDLVVRGLTREEVLEIAERPLDPDGFLAALGAAIRSAREMKAEWEREERDATSYTDEQGRRLWLEQGEGGVAIATPDGDPLVPHPALLAVVNAARERDGLPGVVSAEEHARLLRDWTHLREAADSRIAQAEADRDSYRVSKNLMQEQRDEQLERADRAEAARGRAEAERDRLRERLNVARRELDAVDEDSQ